MDNSQNSNEEKLIEAPAEEQLLEAPEEEKLLPEHASSTKKSTTLKLLLGLIGAITLFVVAFAVYSFVSQSTQTNINQTPPIETVPTAEPTVSETPDEEMTACTMDAKICPDGTSVGRTGPNCEFAACPGEN